MGINLDKIPEPKSFLQFYNTYNSIITKKDELKNKFMENYDNIYKIEKEKIEDIIDNLSETPPQNIYFNFGIIEDDNVLKKMKDSYNYMNLSFSLKIIINSKKI